MIHHVILFQELGIEQPREKDPAEAVIEYEGPEVLCGGILWDTKNDIEQAQALAHAAVATCELRFEQVGDFRVYDLMAECNIVVPPLLMYWRYCSLGLKRRNIQIDVSMQERCNSSALAMELHLPCTNNRNGLKRHNSVSLRLVALVVIL